MMENNYGITQPKSMTNIVTSLFESTDKILAVHCKLNEIAMTITQSIGYNGFKRWHRYRSKEFLELKFALENLLFDEFRITPTIKEYELTYSPSSLEEHLRSWDSALSESIENLGSISNEYYETVGRDCKPIEKAIKIMVKDKEKIGKYIERFTQSDWLTLDMHIVDDKIHKKYKEKENECC